jgi:asparagine synthase (glutamine-hydrolysing)
MCGIVAFAAREAGSSRPPLDAMRDTLRHRGPDDSGLWWSGDGRVGLAMRRLAIIDLSPGGHQPMSDSAGRCCITFNGEIYNYRLLRAELEQMGHCFRTASDTEVILAAYGQWGTDCLSRLNGMFAFALYDIEKKRLFCARDRAGEKPFFYRHANGTLVLASELKALMADPQFPRELDGEGLNFYLTYGYVPGSLCILKGVHKLPQGHAMTFDLDRDLVTTWAYWKLPDRRAGPDRHPTELVRELENLLLDSVRLRMISDVPIGIMLSGGIDSSLVTAMAARVSSRPVKTFTISFPGHGDFDEAPHARIVARHFGTEHLELAAEPATVDLLPELARQYDEPLGDSSMVPTYVLSRLIRRHATVALGGDGGDELFGGYLHYDWIERQQQVMRALPGPLRRAVGSAATILPPGIRGRNYLIAAAGGVPRVIAHVNLFFDVRTRRRLLAPSRFRAEGTPEDYKAGLCRPEASPLTQATEVDFETYLVDDILVKVDRASMLTSLEVRAPWLDPRIIDLAFREVPDALRATKGKRKILPRLLAKALLPADLDLERKQGFALPLADWFRGDWGCFIEEVLSEADPMLFDRPTVRSLVRGQNRGLVNTQRLFALVMFELWRRHYGIRV